jgi:hypothetical protein
MSPKIPGWGRAETGWEAVVCVLGGGGGWGACPNLFQWVLR